MFKNVPLEPAIVVGSFPSHAFAFKYSMYSGDNSVCLILIAFAAACALIIVSALSARATATFLSPSALAAIAC